MSGGKHGVIQYHNIALWLILLRIMSCFGCLVENADLKSNVKKNRHSMNDGRSTPTHHPPLYRSNSDTALISATHTPLHHSHSSCNQVSEPQQSNKVLLQHPSASSLFARRLVIKHVLLVYNPSSGAHKGEKIMMLAKHEFSRNGIAVDTIPLTHRGHATEICKTYNLERYDVLCVVGGDGTFHECINGLMSRAQYTKPQSSVSSMHLRERIHSYMNARVGEECPSSAEKLPALAVLPAGTGNSLVLELCGVKNIKHSIATIMHGVTIPIDMLKVTILEHAKSQPAPTYNAQGQRVPAQDGTASSTSGNNAIDVEEIVKFIDGDQVEASVTKGVLEKEVIYAFNSIHWGLGAKVSETAERLRWMGHAVRYTSAALMEIMRSTSTRAKIVTEDAQGRVEEIVDSFSLLIANNIGTAAKGMRMAPKAKINDGLIDLLLFKSHKIIDLVKVFKKVYKGTHTELPFVEYKQVRKFTVTPYKDNGKLQTEGNSEVAEELVDIDGELKGVTPFMCEVLPNALEIII